MLTLPILILLSGLVFSSFLRFCYIDLGYMKKNAIARIVDGQRQTSRAFFLLALTYAWTGQVIVVTDGNIIKILKDGRQIKISLYGGESAGGLASESQAKTAKIDCGNGGDGDDSKDA